MKIIAEIHSSIERIILNTIELITTKYPDSGLYLFLYALLKRLIMEPKMLRVLILIKDYKVWEKNLRWIVEQYATSWQQLPDNHRSYLCKNFCFQFMLILEKWMTADFNDDYMQHCINYIKAWLEMNEVFSPTIEELLYRPLGN